MANVKHAFEKNIISIPIANILPTRTYNGAPQKSFKFKAIMASVNEIGVIEPLAIHPHATKGQDGEKNYILLDGHLRLEALRQLGATEALCLVSTDDEGYTCNRQINRLTAIQEHKMIMEAINKGVAPDRIAKSLNIQVGRVRQSQNLLVGITPEVVSMLKTKVVSKEVFSTLRKMKPMRQIETAEMMDAASCFSLRYAQMLLSMTPAEQLNEKKEKLVSDVSVQDIMRMETEMERLYANYRSVEDSLGETMLLLVVAKGYISRLLRNDAVAAYIRLVQPELGIELNGVLEAITVDARSMERE